MSEDSQTKALFPTESYMLRVPVETVEDVDERVMSLWVPEDDTLLQISSYRREAGQQVRALERLRARLERETLTELREEKPQLNECPDIAAASGRDSDGTRWLYVYAVWPDLTMLISISHPKEQPTDQVWAMAALQSIRRTI